MSDLRLAPTTGVRPGWLLDSVYLVAVVAAVVLGGAIQLALAVPVAGVLAGRALHRHRQTRPSTLSRSAA